MNEYRDLLPVIIEQEAAALPDGCDTWAIKSVRPDLRTRGGFRWAYPGGTSRSDHATDRDNTSACPNREGDGLCVAFTWDGMASGGIPTRTLLLVAYPSANVLGYDSDKARLAGEVRVVALVDGERFVRENGAGANLTWADLSRADLIEASLAGADLIEASLTGADLIEASLTGANLYRANLTRANLYRANLYRANLAGANLREANLTGADLYRADLTEANLTRANLAGANLYSADLDGAHLTEVRGLTLPSGWTLTDAGTAVRS